LQSGVINIVNECMQSDAKRRHSKSCFRDLFESRTAHHLKYRGLTIAWRRLSCRWSIPRIKEDNVGGLCIIRVSGASVPACFPSAAARRRQRRCANQLRMHCHELSGLLIAGILRKSERCVLGRQTLAAAQIGDRAGMAISEERTRVFLWARIPCFQRQRSHCRARGRIACPPSTVAANLRWPAVWWRRSESKFNRDRR
jgi:hypothetical protein